MGWRPCLGSHACARRRAPAAHPERLPAAAQDAPQERSIAFSRGRVATEIQVPRGQFLTARTASDIGRVVVGDPAIASAVPTNTRSFYILGRTLGRTNVAIHDPNDTLVGMLEVEVNGDTPDLAESIREAIPKANVRVESVNGRTRLSGAVPDAIALRRVLEIAAQYGDNVVNALRVTGG